MEHVDTRSESQTRLDKVDELRARLRIGYAAASDLLDSCEGDVLAALISYESRGRKRREALEARSGEMFERVRGWVRSGNVTRVRVKKDERVLLDLPVTLGVAGAALAPEIAALAAAACLAGRCRLEIERGGSKDETETEAQFGDYTGPEAEHRPL